MSPIPIELTIAIAVFGGVLVVFSIVRLLAVVRGSVIARLPAVPEQDVLLAQPGPYVLCIEVPHFSSAFAGTAFTLRDAGGREVPSAPIVFRTKVSGFARVRLSVRSFDVDRAGQYRLSASGLAARDTSDSALVFTRPFAGTMVLWIVGIVLGGIALIGGIVFSTLRASGKI